MSEKELENRLNLLLVKLPIGLSISYEQSIANVKERVTTSTYKQILGLFIDVLEKVYGGKNEQKHSNRDSNL